MIMMPYGSRSSLQLTGRAHFWHPTGGTAFRRSCSSERVRNRALSGCAISGLATAFTGRKRHRVRVKVRPAARCRLVCTIPQ